MSSTYNGVASNFNPATPVQITVPSDGDPADAASVNSPGPFEPNADALEWFRQNAATVGAAAPSTVCAVLTADITSIANGANFPLTPGGALSSTPAMIAPFAGKISKLYCHGPSAGGGQVGIGINSTSINTSVAATVTPGSTTSDLTHSATFAAGDQIFLIYHNNTGGTVATLRAGLGIYAELTLA